MRSRAAINPELEETGYRPKNNISQDAMHEPLSALTAAHATCGDLQGGIAALGELPSMGSNDPQRFKPFHNLMQHAARVGDVEVATRIVGLMRSRGLQPSIRTYGRPQPPIARPPRCSS